ncbi:hypothetical protein HDU98_004303 [Podochytrium sp. JEL0797]|nr:hypothetical protein HDU98_004303 [Podochytrium sp. JEL0797]
MDSQRDTPSALPYSAFSGPPAAKATPEEPVLARTAKKLVASVRRLSQIFAFTRTPGEVGKKEKPSTQAFAKPREPCDDPVQSALSFSKEKYTLEPGSENDASKESNKEHSHHEAFIQKEYNRRHSFASKDLPKFNAPSKPPPGPPPPHLMPNLAKPSASSTPSGSHRSSPHSSPIPSKQPTANINNLKSFASQTTAKKHQHRKSHMSTTSGTPSSPSFYPTPMMQPTTVIYVPVPMIPAPPFAPVLSNRSSRVFNTPDSDTSEEDSIPLQLRHEDSIPLQLRLGSVNSSSKRNSVASFIPSSSLAVSSSPRIVQDASAEEETSLSSSETVSSGGICTVELVPEVSKSPPVVAVTESPAKAAIRKRQSVILLAEAARHLEEEQVAESKRKEGEDARSAIRKKRESMVGANALAILDKVTTQDEDSAVSDIQKQSATPTPPVLPTAKVDAHPSVSFDPKPTKRFSLADLRQQQFLEQQLSSSPLPSKRFSTFPQLETHIPGTHIPPRPTSAYITPYHHPAFEPPAPHQVMPSAHVVYPTQPLGYANPALFAQQQQQQQQPVAPSVSAFDQPMKELKRKSVGPLIKFSKEEEQVSSSLKMAIRTKLDLEERAVQQEMLRVRGEQRGEGYA